MAADPQRTVVIAANSAWNLVNFRIGLIRALQAEGHRVIALAPNDEHSARLAALGVEHHPVAMRSSGISPFGDLLLLARYVSVLRKIGAGVFLGFTIKPNIYGSLAARAVGMRVINNISGLGTAFIRAGLLTRIATALYKLALRGSSTVFFQNRDDLDLFVRGKIVRLDQARIIPGSGIDLERFKPREAGSRTGDGFGFLLIARLLRDKGVQEYVEAARTIKEIEPKVHCRILGFVDVDNRTAVPRATLDRWVRQGWIEYLGSADDVRPYIAEADCIVLPSYREGMPRALLEASAMGKPVVGSDVPGVREAVEDGVTGFLCEVRSARSLADVMLKMIQLSRAERIKLGAAGRRKVEQEFGQDIVIQSYLAAIAGSD